MYNARIKTKDTDDVTHIESLSFSLNRVIANRVAHMLAALAGLVILVYMVVLVPGAVVIALPGGVYAAGKIYDETRIIQYLRYGDPVDPGVWENAELSSEMARIKASENRDASRQFSR
ncbi:MAG: hypothetical protein EAX87_00465 [Candidatus Thorarchaeota archaeon]|nr:hypothetical protein [Candidatus Thorarchaeota archaeon]